ncbi:Zinc/iron permease [Haematococcus lacustris]
MHDRGHLSHHHHHAHDISQELGIWQHLPKIFRADQQGGVPLALKVAAAVLLCGEAIVGMMVPLLVSHMHTHQWWMGLLNAFSGGVFLAAGLMHLIPHCQEAQLAVDLSRWGLPAEYPLYLLLVTLGYLLVLMVERVVFEGHSHSGHSHSHDHERPHVHSPLKHHSSDSEESNHSSGHTLSGHPRPRDGSAVPRRKRRAKADAEASAAGADGIAAGTTSCTEPDDLAAPAGSCASPLDQGPETPALLGGKEAHLAHPAPTFRPLAGLTLLTGMTVHTALECLALGIITNHASFMALLVAIASHKAISALALSARFVREGASTHQVLAYVGPFCLVPPLSIAFGMWAGQLAPGVHLVLSCFAAGTFLYVGCSEVLAEEFEGDVRCGRRDISAAWARWVKFAGVMLAVLLIAALGLLPHGH